VVAAARVAQKPKEMLLPIEDGKAHFPERWEHLAAGTVSDKRIPAWVCHSQTKGFSYGQSDPAQVQAQAGSIILIPSSLFSCDDGLPLPVKNSSGCDGVLERERNDGIMSRP